MTARHRDIRDPKILLCASSQRKLATFLRRRQYENKLLGVPIEALKLHNDVIVLFSKVVFKKCEFSIRARLYLEGKLAAADLTVEVRPIVNLGYRLGRDGNPRHHPLF